MGCFYTGFDYKNRKNGYFKIGETGYGSPARRFATIRQYDSFQCLGYIVLIDETKAQRLFVESYVRMMMEQVDGLTQVQNDHFTYQIENKETKYEQAQNFANLAIAYAEQACKIANIDYKVGTQKFKRG